MPALLVRFMVRYLPVRVGYSKPDKRMILTPFLNMLICLSNSSHIGKTPKHLIPRGYRHIDPIRAAFSNAIALRPMIGVGHQRP